MVCQFSLLHHTSYHFIPTWVVNNIYISYLICEEERREFDKTLPCTPHYRLVPCPLWLIRRWKWDVRARKLLFSPNFGKENCSFELSSNLPKLLELDTCSFFNSQIQIASKRGKKNVFIVTEPIQAKPACRLNTVEMTRKQTPSRWVQKPNAWLSKYDWLSCGIGVHFLC